MSNVQHLLVDGSYVVWRSFLATPPLQSRDGHPTNAIHGFLGAITSALKGLGNPTCHIAWDGGSSGRGEQIEGYKQNRQKSPPELLQQIPIINEISQFLGWQTARVQGFEADDILYTWVRRLENTTKALFTTDKDLISLVDTNTFIYERQRGKSRLLDYAYYTEKWGIPPSAIPDLLALNGDKVDCIPGIRGLGSKTATKLLQNYQNLDGIFQAAEAGKLKEREQQLVLPNKEQILSNRKVVQLQYVPVNFGTPNPQLDKAADLLLSLDMLKSAEKLAGYKPISGPAS